MTDTGERPVERMARMIRTQARACAQLGSPLYAGLLEALADDVLSGGPGLDVLRGHEGDPGPSGLALRLMGGVHRIALERRAPGLALHYPSVGGSAPADPALAWPALREVLVEHRDELCVALARDPQTNEVGRASALVGGLLHVVAAQGLPIRLAEIGTSGGLNLRADGFRVEHVDGPAYGPEDSPVLLPGGWAGVVPPLGVDLRVVERRGCDLAPVDPTTPAGRTVLTSFVWADMTDRFERLRGALELARRLPAEVVAASAADFVDSLRLAEGTTLVVWHSVMWQYLDPAERARVVTHLDALGAGATPTAGLAHLALEPGRRTSGARHEFLVTLRTWPGGEERLLGAAPAHGLPTTWE